MQNPLGSAETEASVFLSVCSWSGITDLKLQLSLAFKDGFIWRLQHWVTLPRESGLLLHQALLSGSSVVWRSDGPRGISVTNASSLSLKVRTNGVWGFFSSSCNIPPEETPLYRPFPTALFNNE